MAIGRFTARDSWNMFSSMSRLGFSRSMTMTSGSISAMRRAMPVTSWMTVTLLMPGLPQAGLDDRGADAVFVDDQDGERTCGSCRILRTHARLCNAAR